LTNRLATQEMDIMTKSSQIVYILSGLYPERMVHTNVINVPIIWLKNIIKPFVIGSDTGYVSSTLKLKQVGIMGMMNTPTIVMFAVSNHVLPIGKVMSMNVELVKVPKHKIRITLRYWFDLSRYPEIKNEDTSPKKIKHTPNALDAFALYPKGFTRLFTIAPRHV